MILVVLILFSWAFSTAMADTLPDLYGCCFDVFPVLGIKRNESGHVLSKTGINSEIMDWLSASSHIGVSCAPVNARSIENSSTSVGYIFYMKTGVCNAIIAPIVARYDRFLHFDFVHPFNVDRALMVIPKPSSTALQEYSALVMPFDWNLWVLLAILLVVITALFVAMDRLMKKDGDEKPSFGYMWFLLLVAILLYKSEVRCPEHLRSRIIMGAWGLAVVIISAYYCSMLTSYIISPGYRPLVDSVEELADFKHAYPVVIRGFGADVTISKSEDSVIKKLAAKLNASPSSRCSDAPTCLNLVKQGSSVFIHSSTSVSRDLMDDYKNTGECNLALCKNEFGKFFLAWGVTKHSVHLEMLNRGTLRMREAGLIDLWTTRFSPMPYQCFGRKGRSAQMDEFRNPTVITLDQLKSVFVITAVACAFAFSRFVWENRKRFLTLF